MPCWMMTLTRPKNERNVNSWVQPSWIWNISLNLLVLADTSQSTEVLIPDPLIGVMGGLL